MAFTFGSGGSGFGVPQQPAFSQFQQAAAPASTFGVQGFGAQPNAPAFGAQGMGGAQGFATPAFSQFSAQGASGFGQAAPVSAFGAPAQQGGFGATGYAAPQAGFGAAAPAFGFATQGSGFGVAPAPNAFGATSFNAAPASGGFGGTGFGVGAAPASSFNAGGTVGFQSQTFGAPSGFSKSAGDKGEGNMIVNSNCAKMKDQSIESQRLKDYSAGSKGGQQGFGMAGSGGAPAPCNSLQEVVLARDIASNMYGFELVENVAPLSGCVIQTIRTNGPAHLSGKMSVGQKLMKVNGSDVSNLNNTQIMQLFSGKNVITLHLSPSVLPPNSFSSSSNPSFMPNNAAQFAAAFSSASCLVPSTSTASSTAPSSTIIQCFPRPSGESPAPALPGASHSNPGRPLQSFREAIQTIDSMIARMDLEPSRTSLPPNARQSLLRSRSFLQLEMCKASLEQCAASNICTPAVVSSIQILANQLNQSGADVGQGPATSSINQLTAQAGSSTSLFGAGTSSIGSSTSLFGGMSSGAGSSTSLFGAGSPAIGSSTSLFGGMSSGAGSSTSLFGAGSPAFGSSASLFGGMSSGAGSSTSLFGAGSPAFGSSASLFGGMSSGAGSSTSLFGAGSPAFGSSTSLFGGMSSGAGSSTSLFGAGSPATYHSTSFSFGPTTGSFGNFPAPSLFAASSFTGLGGSASSFPSEASFRSNPKPLIDMTSEDIAAEVAKVEGCEKYRVAWSCSDIDGPNVVGCNEEELNEYLVDIPGVAENADHRKRILQHLMGLKATFSKGISASSSSSGSSAASSSGSSAAPFFSGSSSASLISSPFMTSAAPGSPFGSSSVSLLTFSATGASIASPRAASSSTVALSLGNNAFSASSAASSSSFSFGSTSSAFGTAPAPAPFAASPFPAVGGSGSSAASLNFSQFAKSGPTTNTDARAVSSSSMFQQTQQHDSNVFKVQGNGFSQNAEAYTQQLVASSSSPAPFFALQQQILTKPASFVRAGSQALQNAGFALHSGAGSYFSVATQQTNPAFGFANPASAIPFGGAPLAPAFPGNPSFSAFGASTFAAGGQGVFGNAASSLNKMPPVQGAVAYGGRVRAKDDDDDDC